jgi:2-C-methyl-D-erythritol 4-phosphate cytidylyltransferase
LSSVPESTIEGAGRVRAERHPVWGVVVAGGSGARFGSAKQFVEVRGAPVLHHSVAAAAAVCDAVVAVVPAGEEHRAVPGARFVVAGGATRSESVRAGLAAVPADAQVIVVHDAARPNATTALFEAVIAAVIEGADAAVPGVAVTDTLRSTSGGVVDRAGLVAVQTPQAFPAAWLRRAHSAGGDATDDAGLVEAIGGTVVVVPGERANLKLTEPADLAVIDLLWVHDRADARMGG